jgi:hypothetical protein
VVAAFAADRLGTEDWPLLGATLPADSGPLPHPEMGYRSCLGLLRLGEEYGPKRLESACERALLRDATTYRVLGINGKEAPGHVVVSPRPCPLSCSFR